MILLGQAFLWASHISLRRLSEADRRERSQKQEIGQVKKSLASATLSVESEDSR